MTNPAVEKPTITFDGGISASFAPSIRPRSELRRAITANYRQSEAACVGPLLQLATFDDDKKAAIAATARNLVALLRNKRKTSGVSELVQEYSLSSQEGIALMCLAEALLRIPDSATRDALIRDKISNGNWNSHFDRDSSLFVNAATWGLVITGKLTSAVNESRLSSSLLRLIHQLGEPIIRRGIDIAMKLLGEQFVIGETIEEALYRSHRQENLGFRYSFDMLGEAALTAQDATRYFKDYEYAIHAIGKDAAGRGIYHGPGISIKLSALHPRYQRSQASRVMSELLPRLKALAKLAKTYDIGINIDAEESDRLELSLDLLESLCLDEDLSDWDGLGFVVQAYSKRCSFVLDYLIDLARRTNRRLMIRLVKGAYWDAEIKRAQVDGLEDFPVFTRKVHTDISYIAAARKLLSATDVVFPQFATHNAQSLATIFHLAGPDFYIGKYEFQCLHGMGEPLYSEVVGPSKLARPCRIYAPVGNQETLLAYLVRRLLENGANSSFIHKVADANIQIDDLVRDPAVVVQNEAAPGQPHPQIAMPVNLLGRVRKNSFGLDLSNEDTLASLSQALAASKSIAWKAEPILADAANSGPNRAIVNPGNNTDAVGFVTDSSEHDVRTAVQSAARSRWSEIPLANRIECLLRAADLLESRRLELIPLIMREAGKSAANAVAEIREAVDFLRYYAEQAQSTLQPSSTPLGPIVCISPWNFPLAIFTGQIAASLVVGNPVLAKPAEETPLIAAECVRILHQAGVPRDGLQLLPGDGTIGAALVSAHEIAGVVFTGSTEVAKKIQIQLASRLSPQGRIIPFIAETGGLNAMIVDSSALPEQVVADVISSAFDSAGQRCSALRLLCIQSDVADKIIEMLHGAMHELRVEATDHLSADVGPVITRDASNTISNHIETMRESGYAISQTELDSSAEHGTYVPPTVIEIQDVTELKREIFGPVLHVARFERKDLDETITKINSTGFGLTFGVHSRIDETISAVTSQIDVGNIYINRNIVGAVVGVQPFGGRGLSGTGPKAGGPLYIHRLVTTTCEHLRPDIAPANEILSQFISWLEREAPAEVVQCVKEQANRSPLGYACEFKGPVGESNLYYLKPRGRISIFPQTEAGLLCQLGAALATGNYVTVDAPSTLRELLQTFPRLVSNRISCPEHWETAGTFAAALIEGDNARIKSINEKISALPGPIPIVQAADSNTVSPDAYCLNWLVEEVSKSINTTAAGGNAGLMALA